VTDGFLPLPFPTRGDVTHFTAFVNTVCLKNFCRFDADGGLVISFDDADLVEQAIIESRRNAAAGKNKDASLES